jgi:hypothetical protein
VARTVAVAKYVKSFRPIEPYLFPTQRISQADAVAAQTDSIRGQLAGWDRAAAMLPPTIQAIDAACDQVLLYLSTLNWPSGRRGTEADGFFASTEAYRQTADRSLEGIAEQLTAAQGRLVELESKATALAEESIARALDSEAALDSLQAAEAIQDVNAAAKLEKALDLVQTRATQQRDSVLADATTMLTSLRENQKSGNELIAQVADQAVGGGYLDFAKAEKKAYGWWNAIAISAALVAFAYLVIVFQSNQHNVEGAVLRVGISLTIVALSAYAFREAGKRQRQSVEARYRALDVLALPPFSNGLSEEQGERLRYLMGERLFGSHVEASSTTRKSGDAANVSVDPSTIRADAYRAAKTAGLLP